jgi:hypothetical protein
MENVNAKVNSMMMELQLFANHVIILVIYVQVRLTITVSNVPRNCIELFWETYVHVLMVSMKIIILIPARLVMQAALPVTEAQLINV